MKPKYVLIAGQGRSGTNWLLDILDLSLYTHCRNEPDKLDGCLLYNLPSPRVKQPFDSDFKQKWIEAIAATGERMGDRDRIGVEAKSHIPEATRKLGALILSSRKLRSFFSVIVPSFKKLEWPIPSWYADQSKLKEATAILKLNQVPGWMSWTLQNQPDTMVIHIVRHPGGYLNSWSKRYLTTQNSADVKKANEERLQEIAEKDSAWAQLFGDIESMSVDESELWFWRYAAETIDDAGRGKDNYFRIVYEELVGNTVDISHKVYDKLQLPCTKEIEAAVVAKTSDSNSIAAAWRSKLSPERITLVEKILSGSSISQWWE